MNATPKTESATTQPSMRSPVYTPPRPTPSVRIESVRVEPATPRAIRISAHPAQAEDRIRLDNAWDRAYALVEELHAIESEARLHAVKVRAASAKDHVLDALAILRGQPAAQVEAPESDAPPPPAAFPLWVETLFGVMCALAAVGLGQIGATIVGWVFS